MDLVLVGPSGSGKTTIGRRLAERHSARFIDLDGEIEADAGVPVSSIFEHEGEQAFRSRETAAITRLGPGTAGQRLERVVATGGGAVIAPANRWALYRRRRVVWLDAPAPVLARRLRDGIGRPLLAGREPLEVLEGMRASRHRFYAAGARVDASGPIDRVLRAVDKVLAQEEDVSVTRVLVADTPVGRLSLGVDNAPVDLGEFLELLGARRAAVVSERRAWEQHGERLLDGVRGAWRGELTTHLVPSGERAKRFAVLEKLVRELARARHERGDPLVAVGGGALGDAAGFAAAVFLRGVPLVQVPTTLLAQIDSAIGGKTGLDLPEGKNLVGAFHQPAAILIDLGTLVTLPSRQHRAALGEAVKYGCLGDESVLRLLERSGPAFARGAPVPGESGALAELVERCAWAKVEVVSGDERESDGRIGLNLGHTIGHAIEAATGYRRLLHGEAVALGLKGALAIGQALGCTPPPFAARVRELLRELGLDRPAADVSVAGVRERIGADKKHVAGRLRWVLPTGSGVVVRSDVPDDLVELGIRAALG